MTKQLVQTYCIVDETWSFLIIIIIFFFNQVNCIRNTAMLGQLGLMLAW